MFESFKRLPDETRLWIYPLDRVLTADEQASVASILEPFLAGWESHGEPVASSYEIVEGQFVLIAGHCPSGMGGCAVDASVGAVRECERAVNVGAFDRNLVFFRDGGGQLVATSRADFRTLVKQGHVTGDTAVVDATIQTLGELRAVGLERPFEESWHARAFNPSV